LIQIRPLIMQLLGVGSAQVLENLALVGRITVEHVQVEANEPLGVDVGQVGPQRRLVRPEELLRGRRRFVRG
jgi:hypothetical protein